MAFRWCCRWGRCRTSEQGATQNTTPSSTRLVGPAQQASLGRSSAYAGDRTWKLCEGVLKSATLLSLETYNNLFHLHADLVKDAKEVAMGSQWES